MKNRIFTFIIGVLVGAIITISCFLISGKTANFNKTGRMPMNRDGQMQQFNQDRENPPAKPEGDFQKQSTNNI